MGVTQRRSLIQGFRDCLTDQGNRRRLGFGADAADLPDNPQRRAGRVSGQAPLVQVHPQPLGEVGAESGYQPVVGVVDLLGSLGRFGRCLLLSLDSKPDRLSLISGGVSRSGRRRLFVDAPKSSLLI